MREKKYGFFVIKGKELLGWIESAFSMGVSKSEVRTHTKDQLKHFYEVRKDQWDSGSARKKYFCIRITRRLPWLKMDWEGQNKATSKYGRRNCKFKFDYEEYKKSIKKNNNKGAK